MSLKIDIIGRGNVGSHLYKALGRHHDCRIVSPREEPLDVRGDADLRIISVSDDAISEVAGRLPKDEVPVAHTSGSLPHSILDAANAGVFYPLQTFTRERETDYSRIPFFVEAADDTLLDTLETVAKSVSEDVRRSTPEQRKAAHLSAAFVCNFLNHLLYMGDEILSRSGLTLETVKPLIEETVSKAFDITPCEAQTGPARRHDESVISVHEKGLEGMPSNFLKTYRVLTDSIRQTYPKP